MLIISFIIFTAFEIISLVGFIRRKNKTLVNETIAVYSIVSILLLLLHFYKINVPKYMIVLCLLTIVLNTFLGQYFNLYNKSKTFDRYLHAFGIFSFSILTYSIITDVFNEVINCKAFGAIIVFSLGMTLGALFDIIEFMSDKLKNTRHQHGLTDTNFDMTFNMIGSVIAAFYFIIFIF